jgi:sulfoxide reductase heme-binding subunit YedZ
LKVPDRILKPTVHLLCLLPLGLLLWKYHQNALGADPIARALNRLGWWTLTLLLVTLTCTPLQSLFKWNWPLRIRRMLGLYAFFYGSLHLLTYAVLDQELDWHDILADIVKRKFITIGFLAWLLMVPLAVTSPQKMLQWLRFKRWKLLHRLVYVCAVLGVVHFMWRVKADESEPLRFAAILAVLLAVRVVDWLEKRRNGRQAPARASAAS